ncbi:MAG TPA: hypothetical protein VMS73_01100, partial [Anaerolineaceae bacterium]|nr:hypothetical protein [Anaerolineaceae bacterium]
YFIHSTREYGVIEQHVSPEYFTSKNIENGKEVCRTIMEVLRYEDLAEDQNRALVDFCRNQIGKPFPKSILGESLTYLFGLPNFINQPDEFSCHSLVFVALDHIGIVFPHHLECCPWFNLARAMGHPLGHSRECVKKRFAYLRDQHLCRDSRFKCVVSLTNNLHDEEILVNENPSKYSWNASLAVTYRNLCFI